MVIALFCMARIGLALADGTAKVWRRMQGIFASFESYGRMAHADEETVSITFIY
jgi:hypothetical protein